MATTSLVSAALLGPAGGAINRPYTVDLTNSKDEHRSLKYWRVYWGDGTRSGDARLPGQLSHTYRTPGQYTIRLRLVDANGSESVATLAVLIQAEEPKRKEQKKMEQTPRGDTGRQDKTPPPPASDAPKAPTTGPEPSPQGDGDNGSNAEADTDAPADGRDSTPGKVR